MSGRVRYLMRCTLTPIPLISHSSRVGAHARAVRREARAGAMDCQGEDEVSPMNGLLRQEARDEEQVTPKSATHRLGRSLAPRERPKKPLAACRARTIMIPLDFRQLGPEVELLTPEVLHL